MQRRGSTKSSWGSIPAIRNSQEVLGTRESTSAGAPRRGHFLEGTVVKAGVAGLWRRLAASHPELTILSLGPYVKVLRPRALQDEIRELLAGAAALYETSDWAHCRDRNLLTGDAQRADNICSKAQRGGVS